MEKSFTRNPSSYRDPSGFVFTLDKVLYRQVNKVFAADYDHFISSGLYRTLVDQRLLIPHETIPGNLTGDPDWHATLKPDIIPFISYPWEWSFDMLKDAALLTLRIMKEAMVCGFILKDATPFNVQWYKGQMVFIDTLSFERYNDEEPWIAYRQFCEQFLGPLLLMHYKKLPLQQLQLAWPDGIPLRIVAKLLPGRSRLSLYTYLHIHLNAKMSKVGLSEKDKNVRFSRQKLMNLVNSLEALVRKCSLPAQKSSWSEYYDEAARRDNYLDEKKKIIRECVLAMPDVQTAADLGANDGEFAKLLAGLNIHTFAADLDPYCINNLYHFIKKNGIKNIQPLIADLAQPSPATGVNNEERASLLSRIHADLVMALALIHHLAIGRNLPLRMIADLFARTCNKYLLVEFVPKTDEKVQLMLSGKKDIYDHYTETEFATAFQRYFRVERKQVIGGSERVLYLLGKHE